MSTTVSMPQLGETVTEGTILKWPKKVGDSIQEDEVLVEISTDKVDTEVPSPASGVILEILVEEGETVGVGTELVVIGSADADADLPGSKSDSDDDAEDTTGKDDTAAADTEKEAAPSEGAEASPVAEETSEDTKAPEGKPSEAEIESFFADSEDTQPQLLSPVVRKLVRENEVDLSLISGSGDGGRITRRDVEAYLAAPPSPDSTPSAPPPAEESAEKPGEEGPTQADTPTPSDAEDKPTDVAPAAVSQESAPVSGEVDLDRIRIRIAENMAKAKRSTAHVWTSVEVDFERVERVRQTNKGAFKEEEGFSLTYLPFIARATIDALKAYPVVNSSFFLEEKKAVFHKNVDLGIAIDLNQQGLVVARVRNADGLRLVGIAREIRELAEKGRDGKLGLDDLTGSTFTITNPGPFGSFMSAPIINVPNVAILSTDTVTKRPAVVTTPDGQDTIAIRHIGYLGLSWDHRAFDGSTAVLFLKRIKENLETWDWTQELA